MKWFRAMLKSAILGLCVACLLLGEDRAPRTVPIAKTEKMDFPANGTLRVQNSTGELTIEGWDQPGIEIVTTKSGKNLDRVQISTRRNGDELVVTTAFPHHRAFPWVTPLQTVTNFDLKYVIRVPRNAKLIVKHDDGDVYVNDVAGNIDVKSRQGMIALRLVSETLPFIDAKSDLGSVNSDFAGRERRRPFPFGHKFVEAASASQNLHLRIGYGDIVILKAHEPKASPPLPVAAGGDR